MGDVDNDGLLDLFVTHLTSETNTLWQQVERGRFRDRTEAGLAARSAAAPGSARPADFDHDGALDIAVANGRMLANRSPAGSPACRAHWEPYGERTRSSPTSAATSTTCRTTTRPSAVTSQGAAWHPATWTATRRTCSNAIGERARSLRNVAPNRGHWLAVRAATGAEIAVRAGGVRRVRVIGSSESFLSAGPDVAQFGLGSATVVDGIDVTWPGRRASRSGGAVDRVVELRKGKGKLQDEVTASGRRSSPRRG